MEQVYTSYIDYLNAFNRWLEEDSPTDKVIVLYYAMLDMFNRRGWPRWAGVDTQRLMSMARVGNKQTAFRARDALVKAGFIEYRAGHKGKISEYRLLIKYGNERFISPAIKRDIDEADPDGPEDLPF